MKALLLFVLLQGLFLIPAAQNVGIGTGTPTRAKFEVNGAVDATSAIFGGESRGISLQRNWPGIGFNTYYNTANIYMSNGYGAKFYQDPDNGSMFLDIYGNGLMGFSPGLTNRAFTISPAGFMGLGAASPNAQLQFSNVHANRKIVLWETLNNNNQFFGFGISPGTLRYHVGGTGDVHRFYSGVSAGTAAVLMSIWGDKKVTISDDNGGGFLGINLSNPTHTLSIKQAAGTGIYIQEAASSTNWHIRAQYTSQTDYAVLCLDHQGSLVGFFRPSGEYFWGSDSRLKTNIENMPASLNKIMQLRPVSYEMKKNNPHHEKTLGFIAQDVKALFPELVSINENPGGKKDGLGQLHAMNYAGFGVVAIKAIQEQQVVIDNISEENRKLKEKLISLESRLERMERSVIRN